MALDLKDIERYEYYVRVSKGQASLLQYLLRLYIRQAGFLKSSPKVTLIPKPTKRSSFQSRSPALGTSSPRNNTASPAPRSDSPRSAPADSSLATSVTWVCTICSYSNPVPSNFDPATANAHTPLPPCLACGIKPALTHVLKAAINNATSRQPVVAPLPLRPRELSENTGLIRGTESPAATSSPPKTSDPDASFQCPRCTFLNHPSLLSCEICGAPLISHDVPAELSRPGQSTPSQDRTDSPGPVMSYGAVPGMDNSESVKISFRNGGDKILYERLKGAITQRKWLLQGAPPVPKSNPLAMDATSGGGAGAAPREQRKKTVGIAGLEQRGLEMRKNNELVIGTAFEDLEALMASAKEIVALAETFSRQSNGGGGGSSETNALLAESASQLGLVTTKDIAGGGGSSNESLYLSELSRNLAEFLTDDARAVLRKAGGIISLVDLWAVFNRARGGVELVSPMDFEKAARLWEELKLPVRLRTFKSGVMVVQSRDRTDETTIKALLGWMQDLHSMPPEREVPWDWQEFGRGVTSRDVAERFGWSIGVAEEELEMAEERGVLCREEGIEGLKFWENFIDTGEGRLRKKTEGQEAERQIYKALKESGFL